MVSIQHSLHSSLSLIPASSTRIVHRSSSIFYLPITHPPLHLIPSLTIPAVIICHPSPTSHYQWPIIYSSTPRYPASTHPSLMLTSLIHSSLIVGGHHSSRGHVLSPCVVIVLVLLTTSEIALCLHRHNSKAWHYEFHNEFKQCFIYIRYAWFPDSSLFLTLPHLSLSIIVCNLLFVFLSPSIPSPLSFVSLFLVSLSLPPLSLPHHTCHFSQSLSHHAAPLPLSLCLTTSCSPFLSPHHMSLYSTPSSLNCACCCRDSPSDFLRVCWRCRWRNLSTSQVCFL